LARTGPQTAGGEFEIRIDKIVHGGSGLGRHEGMVVFVPFSVPGDRLIVRPVERKKNFIRAIIIRVLEAGAGRQAPSCPYFGTCGGCHLQHLEYIRQIEIKRRILEEIFHHRFPETRELLIGMKASPLDYHYRCRARLHVQGSGPASKAGFFRLNSHDIEDIHQCPLLRPALNEALSGVRTHLRRSASAQTDTVVDMICSGEDYSWQYSPRRPEDSATPSSCTAEEPGGRTIFKKIGEFVYATLPSAFFQANDFLAAELMALLRDLVKDRGTDSALDLFAGVGLLTLPLARYYRSVVAVEESPPASRLCSRNAEAAGLGNVRAVCSEVTRWMAAVSSVTAPAFELIALDPPRRGAGPEVMKRIREWCPETIVYVSCDPQTLVRDIAVLPHADFRIDFVEGLDFFPQTYHFETVVRLTRR
jgi:tRNA/tmRNA/rRNA uracil-C5-methylase (TrmA/RlmC/RlmD family)